MSNNENLYTFDATADTEPTVEELSDLEEKIETVKKDQRRTKTRRDELIHIFTGSIAIVSIVFGMMDIKSIFKYTGVSKRLKTTILKTSMPVFNRIYLPPLM